MKNNLQTVAILFFILSLLISGCSPANPAPVTPANTDPPATATPTAPLAATSIATLTATVYPPVFDPETIGDNRVLDSFILTRTDAITGGGEVDETSRTIGYIQEPFSAYNLSKYLYSGGGKEDKKFLIDGRLYKGYSDGGWIFTQEASPDDIDDFQSAAKMGLFTSFVISAQFVGQEDFEGVPANHFTFDQTNLREGTDPTGTYKVEEAVGDLYLTQDGNYLLYFHLKLTGNVGPSPIYGEPGYGPGVREITEELSSINQVTEIAVPADFDLVLDFGLPLPAGSTFVGITRYEGGILPDYYFYIMPLSREEFIEFYRNMVSTNGFTFSRIGRVTDHPVCADYLDQDCVILTKGGAEFILYYTGDVSVSGMDGFIVRAERAG